MSWMERTSLRDAMVQPGTMARSSGKGCDWYETEVGTAGEELFCAERWEGVVEGVSLS